MDYDSLRERMVSEQLIPRGITDERVLSAFRRVPRHEYVPEDLRGEAYEDHPLPIGGGQTISQPYMVALMTESLALRGDEKVLEIGAGSGYQAAILAELSGTVYTVDRVPTLAEKCRDTLRRLGYTNIHVACGDGSRGYADHSPYQAIIVTCAAPALPTPYLEQLDTNGRIVIPVGNRFTQILTLVEKSSTGVLTRNICGCVFVPLVGRYGWEN